MLNLKLVFTRALAEHMRAAEPAAEQRALTVLEPCSGSFASSHDDAESTDGVFDTQVCARRALIRTPPTDTPQC